ncbi:DUF2683 family protein [Candidatus Woesearchaeota archaeon]|nr:DUF2683 family protein [Candidatus Woesearchaeota archaeon]
MVKAIIDIDERTNHVLNIIKAKYALNDKSQAIDLMAEQYQDEILGPELKPEYRKKLSKVVKGKHVSRAAFRSKTK